MPAVTVTFEPIYVTRDATLRPALIHQRMSRDDILLAGLLFLLIGWLVLTVALPVYALLSKAFQGPDGAFIGAANFSAYFGNPALSASIKNSLTIGVISTVLCISLAFVSAYALTRTKMPGRGLFQLVTQLPLLAPSLLPAIGLVYLFGNKGFAKVLLFGATIYGLSNDLKP